jgi:UDP-N-acetylmuramate dehydrogenase
MLQIKENIKLAPYTTFRIGGPALFFCIVKAEDELKEATLFAKEKSLPIMVLGSGSNLLISGEGFNGLVIKNEIKGLALGEGAVAESANDSAILTAYAGESWDGLVDRAVYLGFYGLENLSSIPGTVGAAPVQNIGAYGVEVAQVIESVRIFDTKLMTFLTLSNSDCKFGYRDSIFKRKRGRYVIVAVTFKLFRKGILKMDYKDVKEYFNNKGIKVPTLVDMRRAIIEIRAAKLPNWKEVGTAGSFFKNPVITERQYEELKKKYPDLPGYPEEDGTIKVSLGWILDKICDARGLAVGKAGAYEKQALVVVTEEGATAKDVLALSAELMKRVKEKTGIEIEQEVEYVV